ncbi:AMP-binding protein [Streptomyces venezuelae ATCC 10712]
MDPGAPLDHDARPGRGDPDGRTPGRRGCPAAAARRRAGRADLRAAPGGPREGPRGALRRAGGDPRPTDRAGTLRPVSGARRPGDVAGPRRGRRPCGRAVRRRGGSPAPRPARADSPEPARSRLRFGRPRSAAAHRRGALPQRRDGRRTSRPDAVVPDGHPGRRRRRADRRVPPPGAPPPPDRPGRPPRPPVPALARGDPVPGRRTRRTPQEPPGPEVPRTVRGPCSPAPGSGRRRASRAPVDLPGPERPGQSPRAHPPGPGLRPEDTVAVVLPRDLYWMACVLAVLKAGGTYLPVDPDYPPERVATMLGRAACRVVLTEPGSARHLDRALAAPTAPGVIDAPVVAESGGDGGDLGIPVPADALAYVFFTSGSTGEPKGALVEHAGMLNHLLAKTEDLGVGAGSVVAQTASQCFDISLWQLLAAPWSAAGRSWWNRRRSWTSTGSST